MNRTLLGVVVLMTGCSTPCEPAPTGSLGEPTAWEREFLESGDLPAPPTRATLTAEDGLALSYTDWVPESWDGDGAVLLLVHGSSAHGALYTVLGEGLAARGVYARLIDLRGHGYSRCPDPPACDPTTTPTYPDTDTTWPGRPGDSTDTEQLTRDLHAHLTDLNIRFPNAHLFLAGHSSGAGLVARYTQNVGMTHLRGAVLLAPFNHHEQPQNDLGSWECGRITGTPYAQVDMGAFGAALRGAPHRYVLSFHKQPAYTDPLDTLRYTYTTMTGMEATDPETFHEAFTGPTLWIAGEEDQLLDLSLSLEEYEHLPNGSGFVVVRDTSHVGVTWSDGVASAIAAFTKDPNHDWTDTLDP